VQAGLSDRVHFQEGRGKLSNLLDDAGVVFSEDSTAGMEAMFYGKPLIHTHFANAPPSLPFVKYGAALPGFNRRDMRESLEKLRSCDSSLKNSLTVGQQHFLNDYAGPLDGGSRQRVCETIQEILGKSN
jgi:hypothetical protein